MKIVQTFLILLCLACLTVACSSSIPGSGKATKETRKLGRYTKVEAGGVTKLEVSFGEFQPVVVEIDDNLTEHFYTVVEGDTLKITHDNISPKVGPKVRITLPALSELELSGASKAKLSGFDSPELDLELSGASSVEFDGGVTKELAVEASGSSTVDASSLELERAKVEVSGASKVELPGIEQLDVNASGASEVSYQGEPEITQEVSGNSTVRAR